MTREIIKTRVRALGKAANVKRGKAAETGWYQTFNLDGIVTGKGKVSTIETWHKIKELLPGDLVGLRILDLGCNAGMFSVYPACEGASVVGIDRRLAFINQAKFIREFYEEKFEALDCSFLCEDLNSLDFSTLGMFDWIFAIGIIRYLGVVGFPGRSLYCDEALEQQENIVGALCKIGDNFIVRSNGEDFNTPKYYDNLFTKFGFIPGLKIEDVTEKGVLNHYFLNK